MPPTPPALRAPAEATPTPATPLTGKRLRFIQLYCAATPEAPPRLPAPVLATLPLACQEALDWLDATPWFPADARHVLSAYYGAGYPPNTLQGTGTFDPLGDVALAVPLLNADVPGQAGLLPFLQCNPALSDGAIQGRIAAIISSRELRNVERVRLEAITLLLKLKGHFIEQQGPQVQATQIVIHTGPTQQNEKSVQSERLDIDL